MNFKNRTIRQISNELIKSMVGANKEEKNKIYNDFEASLIEYGLSKETIRKIIRYNFYNFDLLVEYDEPENIVDFFMCLIYSNDSYCFYETIYTLFQNAKE